MLSHLTKLAATALLSIAGFSTIAVADPGASAHGKAGQAGSKSYELVDGDTFSNPGQMFQYLRTRTDAAAGSPKAVVNAYPQSFDNVGDLIQQKRTTE